MLPKYCNGCGRVQDGSHIGCGHMKEGQCVGWKNVTGCSGKYYVTPEEFGKVKRDMLDYAEERGVLR